MNGRILLIEDDEKLGAQIVEHLRQAGYAPFWWRTGRPLTVDDAAQIGLLVLDLMLPGTAGMDILKALREVSDVPVLILSARNDTLDKVRALKLGADDYMTKPFWPEELLARVRARLRRPTMHHDGRLAVGPIAVDVSSRTAEVDGQPVSLTRVELDLLAALAARPGEAMTRQWLVDHVLDPEREGTERTLDVHVSRLRKKLGDAGAWVETVWGIGYRLRAGDDG